MHTLFFFAPLLVLTFGFDWTVGLQNNQLRGKCTGILNSITNKSKFIPTIGSTVDTECPAVPAVPGDRRQDKNTIRLVQYNVEWLFLDYYANADCPGDHCPWTTEAAAQTHMQYVSEVVKSLDPDIMNLCEVEGCDELNTLIGELTEDQTSTNSPAYKPYLIKGTDTSTGQNVGLLTKIDPIKNLYRTEERANYPIPGSKCGYTGAYGTSGVSKHYISEFMLGEIPVVMIGLHFLAYPTDTTRCAEREAQAQVIQNVIAKYWANNYEIVVLGDFNDFDGEVLDANKNMPISQVLDIVKGKSGQMAGQYELTSVASKIIQSERYSDWWDENGNCASTANEFSMIDHILVSQTIQEHIVDSFIYKGYSEFCGTYNSDHYPVVVDFAI